MRHFIEELEHLQERLLEEAGLVEAAVHSSIKSLVDRDETPARDVLRNEARINQLEIEIDESATRLLALQHPMATDLRFIRAAMKINTDLERMGDLAVNIVERALGLLQQPAVKPLIDIPQMASLVEFMVRSSIDSFVKRDADLARGVLASDDAVDDLRDAIYQELIEFMQKEPASVPSAVNLMFVARNLERIADHATNVAEDALFVIQAVDVRHGRQQAS
ncbi:MAG TPA: phosphate signaling complex protein PhoU [Bryobacteraceae bacterium]|nr:phosphate signaling complex protein PhoU [Bryobacteraceae bacterium]